MHWSFDVTGIRDNEVLSSAEDVIVSLKGQNFIKENACATFLCVKQLAVIVWLPRVA